MTYVYGKKTFIVGLNIISIKSLLLSCHVGGSQLFKTLKIIFILVLYYFIFLMNYDVVVSGGESKVQCCKEKYCIGTWNLRAMMRLNWMWSNRIRQE